MLGRCMGTRAQKGFPTLQPLRAYVLRTQEFLRWRDRPGGEKSRISFVTDSISREDFGFNLVPRAFPSKNGWGATHFLRGKPWGRVCFGLYQILKEISPLKLQYCA